MDDSRNSGGFRIILIELGSLGDDFAPDSGASSTERWASAGNFTLLCDECPVHGTELVLYKDGRQIEFADLVQGYLGVQQALSIWAHNHRISAETVESLLRQALGWFDDTANHEVRTEGFDILMPERCPEGCHRVLLYENGEHNGALERVRTEAEAAALIARWTEEFDIPPDQAEALRQKAVETTRRYNAPH